VRALLRTSLAELHVKLDEEERHNVRRSILEVLFFDGALAPYRRSVRSIRAIKLFFAERFDIERALRRPIQREHLVDGAVGPRRHVHFAKVTVGTDSHKRASFQGLVRPLRL
jgi:hypothetical protein